MKDNELLKKDGEIIRILKIKEEKALVIDCLKMKMPKWVSVSSISGYESCDEDELRKHMGFIPEDLESVTQDRLKTMYQRYTLISGALAFMDDNDMRKSMISRVSEENNVSKQTIRCYLCKYLALQDISVLLPKERVKEKELTDDEKNMRWSLNKYFYTHDKNSLKMAYKMMLKDKYCDAHGVLMNKYPSFYQYRYFYRKTRKMQNYYISRNGLTNYQRNDRPCTGDGVQEYAPASGVAMVDATPCDIYLVNESGQVVGRPILTACVDAYSGMCMGYSLSWEGGIYSLRNMMRNVITDKVLYCRQFGIHITENEWINTDIPGKIISDQGSEYIGYTFEQLADLGVTIVNLPSYRPELKGIVEKFFDLIQEEYKSHLKGKGVIEPDFQERGVHDYRKDACLTLADFEKVIIRCIIYYNAYHVLEYYPYNDEMIKQDIKPYANSIFLYGMDLPGTNFIKATEEDLILCLLPRTVGIFGRSGLKVNGIRYKHKGYTEEYLSGKKVSVAYDPDDVSYIWLIEKGQYIRFELIESRFLGKSLDNVGEIKKKHKTLVQTETHNQLQAGIELAAHIETITENVCRKNKKNLKDIRKTRKKEEMTAHKKHAKEVGLHGGT